MKNFPMQNAAPLDLSRLKIFPLAERKSLSKIENLLVDPRATPPSCSEATGGLVEQCAGQIRNAREKGASVILMYGAHLLKNGGLRLVNALLAQGAVTHLATNGAGTIHDWELAFLGRTEESVRQNVASGTFGTWNETGRAIHLALLTGALGGQGYGQSLGQFIQEDGAIIPERASLETLICDQPQHPLTPARAEFLQAIIKQQLPAGKYEMKHPWKQTSILANAFSHQVPLTVHPGIGYDIISNHPMFSGAAIGRAATIDFAWMGGAVERLDEGVVLSIGSAIMAPQVFEKSLSCVNNLRLQSGRGIVRNHNIYVVDIQDGGNWDWSQGEPPKSNPAYYLRFCKSFARMGGGMHYVQADNVAFLHNLLHRLS